MAGHNKAIGDRFVLRTVADAASLARVAAFNGKIHGSYLEGLTQTLVRAFPRMTGEDLVYVEEAETGEVVSSLCLIPWRMAYGAATLTVGEMGIVGTAECLRKQGLVRAQMPHFAARMQAHGCALSLIQGIPYYYRQFGYTYALPLEGGVRVNERELPPLGAAAQAYTVREAAAADGPPLAAFFEAAAAPLALHALRDEETWRYLLGPYQETELRSEWWIVEQEARPVGYLRLPQTHFGAELAVYEVSELDYDAALAVLHHLAATAAARGLPGVRLNVAEGAALVRLARRFGGQDLGRYAWQAAIPNLQMFLTAVAPELGRRLLASPFAAWRGELAISLYRQGATLAMDAGRVQVREGAEGEGVHLPPDAFVPVALGWRSLEETLHFFPDVQAEGQARLLLEVLFPPVTGYLYAAV